jgi:hypothetical protein
MFRPPKKYLSRGTVPSKDETRRFSIGKGTRNGSRCWKVLEEAFIVDAISTNTPRFLIPSGPWIFSAPLAIGFLIASNCTRWRCKCNFISQDGERAIFLKNLRASAFKDGAYRLIPILARSISLDSFKAWCGVQTRVFKITWDQITRR